MREFVGHGSNRPPLPRVGACGRSSRIAIVRAKICSGRTSCCFRLTSLVRGVHDFGARRLSARANCHARRGARRPHVDFENELTLDASAAPLPGSCAEAEAASSVRLRFCDAPTRDRGNYRTGSTNCPDFHWHRKKLVGVPYDDAMSIGARENLPWPQSRRPNENI
jgi:hypothetical protein